MAEKKKRIVLSYTDGKKPDGTPNRVYFSGRTRTEAKAKRKEYLDAKEKGLNTSKQDVTVSEWLDEWVESYNINLARNITYIRRAKKELGHLKLSQVTEAQIVKSVNGYSGKSSAAAENYRRVLNDSFEKAKKNHLILDNPASDINLPESATDGTHRAITEEEMKILFDNWKSSMFGFHAVFILLTGLRRAEYVGLRWDNIDLENRTIYVRETVVYDMTQGLKLKQSGKTESSIRDIPILDPLYDIIQQVDCDKTGFVVRQQGKNAPIYPQSFSQSFKAYMKRLGLNIRIHDLRHTYATMLYDANVDIKTAQVLLGHKDIKMTIGLYTHLSEKRKKDSMDILNNHINGILKAKNIKA